MLESLRKQGSSVFIYAIFGILIAMFVINFRPGGQRGDDSGCGGVSNTALSIDGNEVNLTSFRVAYGAYSQAPPRQRTELAFEALIRRELLADAARAHGLIVSDSLVDDEEKKGTFFLAGTKETNPNVFDQHDDGTETWNLKKFKGWVSEFNVSLSSFHDEQLRELQARLMAEMLGDEVRVSRDEALSSYLFDHNTVTYDSVVFKPDSYRSAMRLTDADVARYLATHEADVKARFTADQSTYEKVNPEIQIRQIVIAKVDAAPASGSGAGSGSGSGATAAVKGVTLDEAKAKLEALAAEIKAGKKKFADVAREVSTDDATKYMGGSVGWRPADAPALGEKAVNDAVKTLKPGEVSAVIVGEKAAYLVTVEATRAGKLEYDAVKLELAETLARTDWAREAAHRDALAAMDKVRGGKALDVLFQRAEQEPDENPLQKIMNDPNLTPKQKQDILQQYIQQSQQHGSITIEGKDIPVGWYADPDGAGGGSAPAPVPAPTPATGSAKGSAATQAPASAKGSAAAPAPAPMPATGSGAAPADDLSKPTSDTLPAFGPVAPPKVSTNGPTPRTPKLPGLGTSKPLADALFDQMSPGDLAKTLYLIDGNFVVVQLVKKDTPSVAEFDKDADHLVAEMRARRTNAAVEDWLRAKCDMLAKSNRIAWNKELLRDTTPDGKPIAATYKPCQSLHRSAAGGAEPGGLDLGTPDPDE